MKELINIYCTVSSFLSSLYSSLCFVVLYYYYLYHYIDTIVIAWVCVCVCCLLNNLFSVSIIIIIGFRWSFFFSFFLYFTCLYVMQSYYLKKNTFVFLITIFSSIIISDIFDVAVFLFFTFAFCFFSIVIKQRS